MAAVKTLPRSSASPLAAQARTSPRGRRQGSALLLLYWPARRILLLCVVLGTALVAFRASLGPNRDGPLHANPVRRGAKVRGDGHKASSSASSQSPQPPIGATSLVENHPTLLSQKSAAAAASLSSSSSSLRSQGPPRNSKTSSSCKFRVRTVRDLQACYPPDLVRPLGSGCDRVTEWEDVQRCLNTQPRASATTESMPRIDHYDISLIGERNSGTKFLIQELQQCIRSLSASTSGSGGGDNASGGATPPRNKSAHPTVKVHRDFHRHKHFFQPLYAGDNYRHRIVIALFRDPVEWVAAMRENPYHSPAHVAGYRSYSDGSDNYRVVPLPWQEFVRRPWTTERTPRDAEILKNVTSVKETLKGETCLYRYSVLDAVPCVFDNETTSYPSIPDSLLRGYVPLYELRRDRSQEPFDNLLQLRSEKIVNFLVEVPLVYRHLGGYVAARYEDLLQRGTRPLLEHVAGLMGLPGLPSDCVPAGPQPERLGRREIPIEFRRWITDRMDQDLERLLGYVPSPPTPGN